MKIFLSFILLFSALSLSSCYRFPEEGEFSTQPTTNNPAVTGKRQETNFMPGMGY